MQNQEIAVSALESIIDRLVVVLPKLIIALIIWYIGKYFIGMAVGLVKRVDTKKVEDNARGMFAGLIEFVGRIILILVILDFLGIGRTIIAAFTQGVTYAIAIALGLSFGKALEGDAKKTVESIKKVFKN